MRQRSCATALALVCLAGASAAAAQAQSDGFGKDAVEALPIAPGAPADRAVERYLQDHGLISLLAAQLQDRLTGAEDESRSRVAQKLARVYAAMLEREERVAERDRIERESRSLLSRISPADAVDLQLTLLRAAYAQAERTAERWLLRLATTDERDEAAKSLSILARKLAMIADAAARRIAALEQQEGAMDGALARRLADRLAIERRRSSMAQYLAGWARAYIALLTGSRQAAADGLTSLASVLAPGGQADVAPDAVALRMLRFEHVARAAIAAALCHAALGDGAEALQWLDLVDRASETAAPVRAELLARRLETLALLSRWSEFTQIVRETRELSPTQARLAATLALAHAATSSDPAAHRAAAVAVSRLTRDGFVAHALDLATIFGVDALPARGFVALYVRGVAAYRDAQALGAHDANKARSRFFEAEKSISAALDASDAPRFAPVAYAAAMTAGAAVLRAAKSPEEHARAADWFERAVSAAPDHDGQGEAMWGAIAALAAGGDPARRASLITKFLAEFTGHARFAAVALANAQLEGVDPVDAAETLLRVGAADALSRAARARAADLLFLAMRAARGSERAALAGRYLDAARPLLVADAVAAGKRDAVAASRAFARARRSLEAAMVFSPIRLDAAENALEIVDELLGAGIIGAGAAQDELDERRVRVLVARGALDDAAQIVSLIRSRMTDETIPNAWTQSASVALAIGVIDAWRSAQQQGNAALLRKAQRRVVDHAAPVAFEGAGAIEDRLREALVPAVAEAAYALWEAAHDSDALDVATRANDMALAHSPGDRDALRRRGVLAQEQGDFAAALDAWRTLSAGLQQGTDGWFEARVGVIRALVNLDKNRARRTLAQHVAMYPSFGSAPWGAQLRDIARSLGVVAPPEDGR